MERTDFVRIIVKIIKSLNLTLFLYQEWKIALIKWALQDVSKFDLLKGYWQVPLTLCSQEITAFVISLGYIHIRS